jgi:hypothetical protein
MPHHPEIVVKLPSSEPSLLLFSASVGGAIRKAHGNEVARDYYNEAKWAKNWTTLVVVIKEWVSVE